MLVVLARPGECFSCNGDIARWFRTPRPTRAPVYFVAAGRPTDREAAALRIARIEVAGVVGKPFDRQLPTPAIVLFRSGELTRAGRLSDTVMVHTILEEVR